MNQVRQLLDNPTVQLVFLLVVAFLVLRHFGVIEMFVNPDLEQSGRQKWQYLRNPQPLVYSPVQPMRCFV